MALDFTGKVVVITGSSAGIGAAAARGFAAGGARVVINYASNEKAAHAVAKECDDLGGEAIVVQADMSTDEGRKNLIDCTIEKWGTIDVLVNNAGTTKFVDHSNLDGLNPDDFDNIYKLNLIGPFEIIKLARPYLAKQGGSIVNIASVAGVRGVGSSLAYVASKGALNSLTLGLARALGPEGIRVNSVCPGFVGTDWFRNVFGEEGFNKIVEGQKKVTPSGHAASAEDIAGPIVFFGHESSHHVTGQHLVVDGGMLLGMPTKMQMQQ